MTVIARKVVVSADARITADLFTDELKIIGDDGEERDPTPREIVRIANGHKLVSLGGPDSPVRRLFGEAQAFGEKIK